ncbi:acetyl-CoA synthetase-like protein [Paxillus ammoniavirescens]|nr:acetyl-CoA synthetase-like protein [Paxillus ammoniavirescens]
MTEISSGSMDCVVPDDLTIPQFFLDSYHPLRPVRKASIPWLIEDATGRHIGFEELRARTFGLANSFKARYDIKSDDVVLIFSPNHVDYPPAMWATHRLGAIVSGANPTYTTNELLYQIQITKPSLVITHPGSLSTAVSAARAAGIPDTHVIVFDQVPENNHTAVETLVQEGLRMEQCFIEPRLKRGEAKSKVAFLNFSSGTSGKPKAVMIPHYGPIVNTIQMALHNKVNQNYCAWEDQRFRPGDSAAGMLPFYHIYGLVISLNFLLFCGVTVVVIPKFNFMDFLQSIDRHKITHLMLVPPQIVLLCKHPATKEHNLTGIRYMISGAAPLSSELMNQVVKVFPNAHIGQGYGLTESSASICMFSVDSKVGVPGSAGRLIPGVVARVVKHDGTLAGYNEPGELRVKIPSLALGYWNNEEATRETFVDGWLHTGDEVVIRDDNEVFIVDRLKEIMKVRGFQVAPAELEGCLLDIADVADACVVPIPDDYSGEVPMAFIVLHPNVAKRVSANPAEAEKVKAAIMKHVADNKVAYKHLNSVEFIDVIPKNPSGKLLRRVLRERAREMKAKTKARL